MARTVLPASPICRATRRTAALSQASPTASSNRLLNGALLGNCGTFSVLMPQSGQRTRYSSITPPGAVLKTGQITHLSLVEVMNLAELPPAPGTHQLPVPTLAPHPQLQRFGLLVDFMLVNPVARPSQNFGPLVLSHPAEGTQSSLKSKPPFNQGLFQIPAQSPIFREIAALRPWHPLRRQVSRAGLGAESIRAQAYGESTF